MPSYYTDADGVRYQVTGEVHHGYAVRAAGPARNPPDAAGVVRAATTWAQVYQVAQCGGCGKSSCARCGERFLGFLARHGSMAAGTR